MLFVPRHNVQLRSAVSSASRPRSTTVQGTSHCRQFRPAVNLIMPRHCVWHRPAVNPTELWKSRHRGWRCLAVNPTEPRHHGWLGPGFAPRSIRTHRNTTDGLAPWSTSLRHDTAADGIRGQSWSAGVQYRSTAAAHCKERATRLHTPVKVSHLRCHAGIARSQFRTRWPRASPLGQSSSSPRCRWLFLRPTTCACRSCTGRM